MEEAMDVLCMCDLRFSRAKQICVSTLCHILEERSSYFLSVCLMHRKPTDESCWCVGRFNKLS